jgi:hypothetical protein
MEQLQKVVQTGEVLNLTPVQMATLLDRAALVERRSRGEATAIIQHQKDEGSTGVTLDLSKLTDSELELFQQLVGKAEPIAPTIE